jgi:tRNA (mo5U34)-methyltransferase
VRAPADGASARAAIAEVREWYHTIELAPGVLTPGHFDLRPTLDRIPWPDVRGKRCLDIATFDGFYAFELERRGASAVVATDLAHPSELDWPRALRERGERTHAEHIGGMGEGFPVAKRILGSSVERRQLNVYDLSPETLGEFDVVVCGSVLLHLRDPLRALEAIRSVCREWFLSIDAVRLSLSLLHRRRPVAALDAMSPMMEWWHFNAAGHRRAITVCGFAVERASRPYSIPYGVGRERYGGGERSAPRRLVKRCLGLGDGVPHQAVLARPVSP